MEYSQGAEGPHSMKPKKPATSKQKLKPTSKKITPKLTSKKKGCGKHVKRAVTKKKAVKAVVGKYAGQKKRKVWRKSAKAKRKISSNAKSRRAKKSVLTTISSPESQIINSVKNVECKTPGAKRRIRQERSPNKRVKTELIDLKNDIPPKTRSKKRKTGQQGKSSKSTKPKVINMTSAVKRPSKKRKKNQKQLTWKSSKSQVISRSDVPFKSPTSTKKSVQRQSKPEANNKAKPKIRLRKKDVSKSEGLFENVVKKPVNIVEIVNRGKSRNGLPSNVRSSDRSNQGILVVPEDKKSQSSSTVTVRKKRRYVRRSPKTKKELGKKVSKSVRTKKVNKSVLKAFPQPLELNGTKAQNNQQLVSENSLGQETINRKKIEKPNEALEIIKNSSKCSEENQAFPEKYSKSKRGTMLEKLDETGTIELRKKKKKLPILELGGDSDVDTPENSNDAKKKKPLLRTSDRLRKASVMQRDLYKHTYPAGGSTVPAPELELPDTAKLGRATNSKRKKRGNKRRPRKRSPAAEDKYYHDIESRRPQLINGSDSESYSTDELMERKRRKNLNRDRNRIRPINMGLFDEQMAPEQDQDKKWGRKSEITPMKIDLNVDWSSIGGLQGHIQKLKEMVVLPMLYPNEFEKFKMQPPKGVLFHGPPGTGKTLVARVLAAQCSQAGKKVSFYMRKGADCLSKWVGEAERQLRLLFDEAHRNQPSIIFFDEIDGLAPVRSSRQDQIHSSIVSTLLALMDGLDGRGQIIIIGATNRIDAIDPALRRPGRFDRELCFTLPSKVARRQILKIKTKSWDPPVDERLVDWLSEKSVGYCGADLEALCREAFMNSIRRTFPQIYHSDVKLTIDPTKLKVSDVDFQAALSEITPAAQRSQVVYARPLPKLLRPLLKKQLDDIINIQKGLFPLSCSTKAQRMNLEKEKSKKENKDAFERIHVGPHRPKLLITAPDIGHGQSHLGVSLLHNLEEFPIYSLDLASLYGDVSCRSPEEVVLKIFKEARKNVPSVIYWPHIDRWWEAASAQLQLVIYSLIQDLPEDVAVFLIATADVLVSQLPETLQSIFNPRVGHYVMEEPSLEAIEEFWFSIIPLCKANPRKKVLPKDMPKLEVAASSAKHNTVKKPNQGFQEEDMDKQTKLDFIRVRTFVRTCCSQLVKHFSSFCETIDESRVASNDLSLIDIRDRNNNRKYPSLDAFLADIDQIVSNVRGSYNPQIMEAREFMNEACHLQDQALALSCQAERSLVERVTGYITKIKEAGGNVEAKRYSEKVTLDFAKQKEERKSRDKEPSTNSNSISTGKRVNDMKFEFDFKCEGVAPFKETVVSKSPKPIKCILTVEPGGKIAEAKLEGPKPPSSCVSDKGKLVVEINEAKLTEMLKQAAKTAKKSNTPIFELEDIYFRVLNHVHYFSASLKRNRLLDLIMQELNRLKKVTLPCL